MGKFLGQDTVVLKNQILALFWNLYAWFVALLPSFVRRYVPHGPAASRMQHAVAVPGQPSCVSIPGPGGLDQLQVIPLKKTEVTLGSNVDGLTGPVFDLVDPNGLADGTLVRLSVHVYISCNMPCIQIFAVYAGRGYAVMSSKTVLSS